MKIPIKLRYSELLSLCEMLEKIIDTSECESRAEAIVVILMLKFYKKIKEKTIINEKPFITMSIEAETAMAFVEFFNGKPFDNASHAGNVVNKLINNYDRQTSKFY